MLLETTLIGEDLVAEVAALFLPGEQEPEEEAIDPAHKARQESAGGAHNNHIVQYLVSASCVPGTGLSTLQTRTSFSTFSATYVHL